MRFSYISINNLPCVTLACDDEQIQAHKVVLSACSPFFRTLFKWNPHPHPLVYLKDVKLSCLQSVVDFMYYGKVYVIKEELQLFLKVAEDLHVLTEYKEHSSDNYDHHPTTNEPFSKASLSNQVTVTGVLPPPDTPQLSSNDNNEELVLNVKEEPEIYQAGPQVSDNIVEQDHVEQFKGDEGQENCREYVEEECKYEAGTMEMDDSKPWREDYDEDMEQNLKNYKREPTFMGPLHVWPMVYPGLHRNGA